MQNLCKTQQLFAKGRFAECLSHLGGLSFPVFDTRDWIKDNDTLVCQMMILCQRENTRIDDPQNNFSKHIAALRKLLCKIQGLPPSRLTMPTELTVAHNLSCVLLWWHVKQSSLNPESEVDRIVVKTLLRVLQMQSRGKQPDLQERTSTGSSVFMLLDALKLLKSWQLEEEMVTPLVLLLCVWALQKITFATEETDTASNTLSAASHIMKLKQEPCRCNASSMPLLLSGEEPGCGSCRQFIDFISALKQYAANDLEACLTCLSRMKSDLFRGQVGLLQAHCYLESGQHSQCMEQLQKELDGSELFDRHHIAQLYNLTGQVLASQGRSFSALQSYKKALQSDGSFLNTLYLISRQYRVQGLDDAELEALNLLITGLSSNTTDFKKPLKRLPSITLASLADFCLQTLLKDTISLEHATYSLAKRCSEQGRFDIAAQKYQTLINLLQDNTRLTIGHVSTYPFLLPEIKHIQLEAAFSLVRSEQYQDVRELCDRLFDSCGGHVCDQQESEFREVGAFDLSMDIDLDSSPEIEFVASTPPPDDLGILSHRLLSGKDTCQSNYSTNEEDFSMDNIRVKRPRTSEQSEGTKSQKEEYCKQVLIATHLYNAEAFAGDKKTKTALACIDCCLKCLKSFSSKSSSAEETSPKAKKLRLDSDAVVKPSETNWKDGLSSRVYFLKSQLLLVLEQLPAALHWSRLALQLCPDILVYQNSHNKLLQRLGRPQEEF